MLDPKSLNIKQKEPQKSTLTLDLTIQAINWNTVTTETPKTQTEDQI